MAEPLGADYSVTTIKVPRLLRKRIAGGAAVEGVTAAVFLTRLVDRFERDRRFEEVRRAYAGTEGGVDSDYTELVSAWDRASAEDVVERDAEVEGRG